MLEIIDTRGNKKAHESTFNLDRNTRKAVRKAFFDVGKDLLDTFNQQVLDKASKTGRIYIKKDRIGRKRRHQASAPGESPANLSGTYRKSAGYLNQTDRLTFGASERYAVFLEHGTRRMEARPGLGNSVQANERNIMRSFEAWIVKEI